MRVCVVIRALQTGYALCLAILQVDYYTSNYVTYINRDGFKLCRAPKYVLILNLRIFECVWTSFECEEES